MRHYKQLPKSAIIKNSVDIQNHLREVYHITDIDNKYPSPDTHSWLVVAISNSNSGYIYYRQSMVTEMDYQHYYKDNPYIKEFITPESLYKYIDQCFTIKKLIY